MATPDHLYNRFVDAWNAGERPDVDDFAAKLAEAQRPQFLRMVSLFLENAPTPPLSDQQRGALESEPAVQEAVRLAGAGRGLWPALLPRLRGRARLTREQLVAQLARQLGVAEQEERVRVYYHEMETGQLDPAGVSRRVLAALGNVLGVTAQEIAEAGDFRGLGGSGPETVFMRAARGGPDNAVAGTARDGDGDGGWDEVDRLFRGGR